MPHSNHRTSTGSNSVRRKRVRRQGLEPRPRELRDFSHCAMLGRIWDVYSNEGLLALVASGAG
jgi:hypothetical protein